jgi:hypothetical protein
MMKVVQGSFDQSDYIRFPRYFGKQCCGIAVTAFCKASYMSPKLWTEHTIDECIIAGNSLFEKSMDNILSANPNFKEIYLRAEELQQEVIFPSGKKMKFEVSRNMSISGLSIANDESVHVGDGLLNYCLRDALMALFESRQCGILTCHRRSTCIMKVDDSYFIFDSHKRGLDGLSHPDGKAVLIQFETINDIVVYI